MTTRIVLPAGITSNLDWQHEIAQAKDAASIIWELDFDLLGKDLLDPLIYESLSVAAQHFTKKIFPEFASKSSSICLCRIERDLAESPILNADLKESFLEWLLSIYHTPCLVRYDLGIPGEELNFETLAKNESGKHLIRVYSLTLLSEYLHRLAALFPDSIEITCELDLSAVKSKAELGQLLSKERFPHITPIAPMSFSQDAPIALCLPPDEKLSRRILSLIDHALSELQEKSYRIIPESNLTESWEGVDLLIAISDAVTPNGKRKLQGFCASGGTVAHIGPELNLAQECSFSCVLQR
jgi:hypothetical protein